MNERIDQYDALASLPATAAFLVETDPDDNLLRAYKRAPLSLIPDLEVDTFTPEITFATPGNLSVSYSAQSGWFTRLGSMILFNLSVTFTPTHTTAAGDIRITGLPYAASGNWVIGIDLVTNAVTWPTNNTQLNGLTASGQSYLVLRSQGSTGNRTAWTVTQFPTATVRSLQLSGVYRGVIA